MVDRFCSKLSGLCGSCCVVTWIVRGGSSALHALLSVIARLSAVRRVKEGTSSIPPQSGFYERWQSDSKECYFLSV